MARAASSNVKRQSPRRWWRSFVRSFDQFFCVHDARERTHAWAQQFGDGFGAAERQEQTNFRIVQDGGLPRGVLLDAVGAKRRVDGDRNRSGEKNPRVRHEESARSRQHQRNASARGYATPRQLRGAPVSRGVKIGKGQRKAALSVITIFCNQQVRTVGVVHRAIPQNIDEGFGSEDSRVRGCAVQLLNRHGSPQCGAGFLVFHVRSWSSQYRARQILGRVGLGSDAVRQTDVERRFQPREKFHAFEAAEAQVAVELRCGIEQRQRALAAQFFEQATDHSQYAFARGRVVELGDGGGHRTQEGICFLPRKATTPKRGLLSTRDRRVTVLCCR